MKIVAANSVMAGNNVLAAGKSKEGGKPSWDGKKVYTYLEDFSNAAISYGRQMQSYYRGVTVNDGEMTVDELKKQIGEMFSYYTLTDREPSKVVAGKHYLYIDESQLNKMAKDASYRADVYGLMDREYTTGAEFTLKYSDGRNVTEHITGSIFSLAEKNTAYNGIPYLGSCMSDNPVYSRDSHFQVRNQSFIYDVANGKNPSAKGAKSDKALAARKLAEKKLAEKKMEKLKDKRKAEKKKQEELLEKRREERLEMDKALENQEVGTNVDYSV